MIVSEFVSRIEAARIVGCHPTTIDRYLQTGQLRRSRFGIRPSDLDALRARLDLAQAERRRKGAAMAPPVRVRYHFARFAGDDTLTVCSCGQTVDTTTVLTHSQETQ